MARKVYTTDVVVEDQEFAESKAAASESAMMRQSAPSPMAASPMPSPAQASSADGFMNIPDGIDEELPFN